MSRFTVEDFEWEVHNLTTCTDPSDPVYQKHKAIREYFINHPEEALKSKTCKRYGVTDPEQLQRMLKCKVCTPF